MQYLKIDSSGSTSVAIVPASTGKKVRVYGLFYVLASAVTVNMKDGSTSLTGTIPAASAMVLDVMGTRERPITRFETTAGAAFNFTLGSAVQISGGVWYDYI